MDVLLPEKTLHVKGFTLAQHVVDRAAQPRRQDAERLLLAVLLLVPGLPGLHRGKVAHEQAHRLGKRPLQMGIADLVAARAQLLARRLVPATHQPGVRQEFADIGKTTDVVNLVQQRQPQNLADAADRLEQVERLRILDLGRALQVQLHLGDPFVERVDQRQIDLDALAQLRIVETLGDLELGAVLGVDQLLAELAAGCTGR